MTMNLTRLTVALLLACLTGCANYPMGDLKTDLLPALFLHCLREKLSVCFLPF